MLRYLLKRLLALIPVLLGVAFLIFTMMYFTPGDPAAMVLGDQASEEPVSYTHLDVYKRQVSRIAVVGSKTAMV